MLNELVIIGYSGHSFVCIENAILNQFQIIGYCENLEKKNNPFNLKYLGVEDTFFGLNKSFKRFIGIGNNRLREIVYAKFDGMNSINLIHPKAILSDSVSIQNNSNTLINAGVTVNALAKVGKGVILNTGCIVEHECLIGDFAHIAPGAVLAGNVSVGGRTFVGANSVVKQGVKIGSDVIIGAGSVVIKDVPNGAKVVGNPGKIIN